MSFLRSRRWAVVRRSALVAILLVVVYRNYGPSITGWFRTAGPAESIRITQMEFQPGDGEDPPAWFIGLENQSRDTTYENIVLEATYSDGEVVLSRDELIVDQRLLPGQEALIGSRDATTREGATEGWVRVIGADVVD